MAHEPAISAAYFGCAFHPAKMRRFIEAAQRLLIDQQFDAIAFRGMSGAMVAPVLAYSLHKSVIMVRKPKMMTQEHHSPLTVEGDKDAGRYLIVDDFRCSGETVRAILEEIRDFAPEARCMGALFYHSFMSYGDQLKLEITREMYDVARSSIFNNTPSPFTTLGPLVNEPSTVEVKPGAIQQYTPPGGWTPVKPVDLVPSAAINDAEFDDMPF